MVIAPSTFDYKAITTIAIAMSIIAYILTLINKSMSSFKYGVQTSDSGILSLISYLYSPLLGFVGSITGMPEWFNALFGVPISIIIIMYLVNRISI